MESSCTPRGQVKRPLKGFFHDLNQFFLFLLIFYISGGTLKPWVPFRSFWDHFSEGISIRCATGGLIFGYVCLALPFKTGIFSNAGGIILLVVGAVCSIISFIFILGHEQNKSTATYKVCDLKIV